MVLRCSLLGHDYGDTDVEREREERGSEVVVTVREYEECTRCGERHVISENTEVRSISTETGVDPRPDEPEPTPEREPASEPDGADATFIDADGTESSAAADRASPAEVDTPAADTPTDDIEVPTDENGDPVTDDGEILEDDGTTARDREHGEWPDSDDVGPPVEAERGPTDWPDDESEAIEDDGSELIDDDSEPIEDDAVLLDTGTTDDVTTMVETEPEPEAAAGGPPSAGETSADPGSGIERAGSAPTPGSEGGTPADDGPSELYCPRCEFAAGSDRSSLRTGDICPDCRKGYLSRRGRR